MKRGKKSKIMTLEIILTQACSVPDLTFAHFLKADSRWSFIKKNQRVLRANMIFTKNKVEIA